MRGKPQETLRRTGRARGRTWTPPKLRAAPQRLVQGRGRNKALLVGASPEERAARKKWEVLPEDYDQLTDFGVRLIDLKTGIPKADVMIEYREAVYWRTLGMLGANITALQETQARIYSATITHLQVMLEQETIGLLGMDDMARLSGFFARVIKMSEALGFLEKVEAEDDGEF